MILFFSIQGWAQELVETGPGDTSTSLDCSKFRDGKFKIIDDEAGNSIIERKGSKQMEFGEGSGLKLEFKVNWVNACTYTLELKKVLENPDKLQFPEGMILTVEMIEIKENSYVQRSTANMFDMVVVSEMHKL